MRGFDQPRQIRAQRGNGRFDRLGLLGGLHWWFAEVPREQRHDHAAAVGTLLLDGVHVEAEAAERFREELEMLVQDLGPRIRKYLDLLIAKREQTIGVIEAEDAQRTVNLAAVLGERGELVRLVVIAEEGVEHLFHVPQVRLDFASNLCDEQALLGAPAQLVERDYAPAGWDSPSTRGIEARQHRVDLLRELRRQAGVILEGALGEKQGGRIFHCQWLRHPPYRRLCWPSGEGRGQLRERLMLHLGGCGMHRAQRLPEFI